MNSDLETNPLRVIKLKKIMKEVTRVLEDNQISMNIESWGGRKKKDKYHLLVIFVMIDSNRI